MEEYEYSSYNEFISGKHQIINNKSIEILFGKTDDFKEKFEFIHNKKIVIQDDGLLTPKIFIKQFEKKHKIKTKVVEIAENLKVSKSTVSKYLRNWMNR